MPSTQKAESGKGRQVVPITAADVRGRHIMIYILLGKTDTGKSRIVECLASPADRLSIAGNGMNLFTREVIAYRVVNWSCTIASDALDVIILDTPGFFDPKIPESRIITMISQKVDDIRQSAGHSHISVLYFTSITDLLIAGSQSKALDLAISLLDVYGAGNIRIVSTMWDRLHVTQRRAERRYKELKSEMYKRADRDNIDIMVLKFDNTRKSALSILDKASCGWNGGEVSRKGESRHKEHVRGLLVQRISSLLEELEYIQEDLRRANTSRNQEWKDALRRREREASQNLLSFYYDLYVIDPEFYHSQFPDAPFPPLSSKSRMEKVTGALKRLMPFSK